MNPGDWLALGLLILVVGLIIRNRFLIRHLDHQESERLQLRRELVEVHAREKLAQADVETLKQVSFEGVIIADAQHRVIHINSAALQLFHVDGDAFPPTKRTLMSITRNHEIDDLVVQALQGKEPPEAQLTLEERTLRIRVTVTELRHVVVVLEDVTELLRLTRARRDMIANLSHDLRTPISNIRLLVESLTLSYGKNPERDQKTLGKIAGVAEGLQHMTQELVDLSTIESGKAMMRMVNNQLHELVRNALTYVESQVEQKHLEIVNEVAQDATVLSDTDQIRRVITNILHNAVKFTPDNGQIRLTTRREGQFTILSIKDTGPGIPPAERNRIFERFYQVDAARSNKPANPKENSTGTGLGLAIAKHIVEAHGGKIWAEAGIPTGACISFSLPLV